MHRGRFSGITRLVVAWLWAILGGCTLSACSIDDRNLETAVLPVQGSGNVDAGGARPPAGVSNGLGLGASCFQPGDCASGFCADGVCCNGGCGDVCASCNVPGTEGTCSPIPSDPLCTALECPAATECRGVDTSQTAANCEGIGVCRTLATCQVTNFALGTSCANGTGACDGNGACVVAGKLTLAAACTSDDQCAEGFCAGGAATMCCDAACDGECQQCSATGHCEEAPAGDPRCATVTCPPSNVCRQYSGDLPGACHGFGACAAVTDCAYTELRSPADCSCDAQGGCTLVLGRECQSGAECASGACVAAASGKSICCVAACGAGSSCAEDGSGCVECSGDRVSCEGSTELRCQADGHFARNGCQFGCTEGQGCNALPGLGFACDVAAGCLGGLPCQQDSGGASRCCARDCAAEGRICAENGSCVCPPDQVGAGDDCLLLAGDPCTAGAQCQSAQCVDGVCCQEACAGACEQCQAGTGACVALPGGQPDPLCGAGKQCSGQRADCRSNVGVQCTTGSECASSNCEASVTGQQRCCAASCAAGTACSNDGQRCVECDPSVASNCGNGCNPQTFTCNALRAIGSACGSNQQCAAPGQCLVDNTNVSRCCEANCAASGKVCDPSGSCVCPANQVDVNGRCVNTPGQACTDDASCSTNACSLVVGGGRRCCARACNANELCSADGSACIDQRGAVGASCAGNADCQNDNCVNGVCCSGSCGACQRCQQATGLCQADPSASCTLPSGAPGTCTQGQCTDPGAGPGQLCGARACQAGLVCTSAGVCCNSECDGVCESACSNGQGSCNVPATDARCGQTQCSAGQCQASQPLQTNRSCVSPGVCAGPNADQCSSPVGTSGGTCNLAGGGVGQCASGSCQPILASAGTNCSTGGDCQSGVCIDGICCGGACDDECSTCQPATGACTPVAPRTPCGTGNQLCIGGACTSPSVLCAGDSLQITGGQVCCEVLGDALGLREEIRDAAACLPSFLDGGGLTTTPITCDSEADCRAGELCCLRSVGESAIECTPEADCTEPGRVTQYQVCRSPQGLAGDCRDGVCSEFFLGGFVPGWNFCQ